MFEIMMSEFETSLACWQWHHVWRRVNPMPRPAHTFAFNDQNTHKHQHALNDFVLDHVTHVITTTTIKTYTQSPDLNDLIDPALIDPDIAINDLDLALNDLDPPMMTRVLGWGN